MDSLKKVTCCNECPMMHQSYMPVGGPLEFQIWRSCSKTGDFLGKYSKLNKDRPMPIPNWCPCCNKQA